MVYAAVFKLCIGDFNGFPVIEFRKLHIVFRPNNAYLIAFCRKGVVHFQVDGVAFVFIHICGKIGCKHGLFRVAIRPSAHNLHFGNKHPGSRILDVHFDKTSGSRRSGQRVGVDHFISVVTGAAGSKIAPVELIR